SDLRRRRAARSARLPLFSLHHFRPRWRKDFNRARGLKSLPVTWEKERLRYLSFAACAMEGRAASVRPLLRLRSNSSSDGAKRRNPNFLDGSPPRSVNFRRRGNLPSGFVPAFVTSEISHPSDSRFFSPAICLSCLAESGCVRYRSRKCDALLTE